MSNSVFDVAHSLVADLNTALASTPAGQPNRACVVPASIAWDQCECGLLAVAATRQYVTDSFPANVGDGQTIPSSCRSGFVAAELVIQIIRCAPTMNAQGDPPSCDQLEESALEVLTDAWVVLGETQCFLDGLRDANTIVDYIIRNQTFPGPHGGCVGSELHVTLELEWD